MKPIMFTHRILKAAAILVLLLGVSPLSAQAHEDTEPRLGLYGEIGQAARLSLFKQIPLQALQYNLLFRTGVFINQARGRFFVLPSIAFHFTAPPRAVEGSVISVRGDTIIDAGLGIHFRLGGETRPTNTPMWLGFSFHGSFGSYLNSRVLFFSPGTQLRFTAAPFPGKGESANLAGKLRTGFFGRWDLRRDETIIITGGAFAGFSW